jgi:hypothetical protein
VESVENIHRYVNIVGEGLDVLNVHASKVITKMVRLVVYAYTIEENTNVRSVPSLV